MIPVKLNNKPQILKSDAEQFVVANWSSISPIRLEELVSYDSRTYLVESSSLQQKKYIFKISNAIESRDSRYFECISRILHHLEVNGIGAQKLIEASNGKFVVDFRESQQGGKAVDIDELPLKSVMLSYIEGEMILNKKITEELCLAIGEQLNKLTDCVDQIASHLKYLVEFTDLSIWNIKNASEIREFIPHFDCTSKRALLTLAVDDFEEFVVPKMDKLSRGFIHGDPNDMNTIVDEDQRIYFIDWQDCSLSFKVYDLAILIFSLMSISLSSPESLDLFSIGKYCLQGYLIHNEHSLNDVDIDVLPIVVQTRVALSLSVGYYTNKYLDPNNKYLLHSQQMGWKILEDLLKNRNHYSQRWKRTI